MITAEVTAPELYLDAAPRAAVSDLRIKNGLVVAWVRAILATGTLVPHAASGALGRAEHRPGLVLHFGLALVALAALGALARRWRQAEVVALSSLIDVAGLAGGAWLLTAPGALPEGAVAAAAFMVALTEIFVLSAALSLPASIGVPVGGLAILVQVVASLRAGLHGHDLAAVVLTLVVFAAVAGWAGTRVVRLAARSAVRGQAASRARREADLARAAHAEAAAERDALRSARDDEAALAAAIVHDLKNPLATLLQYAALAEAQLQETGGPAQVLDDLRLVGDEGRRLAKLIGDLLLVHRLERGGLQLRREATPIGLLIARVADAHEPRVRLRGAVLSTGAPPGLFADVDPELVHRLVENLVSNALRHVAEGDRLEIAAWAEAREVVVAVRNSGPPVPAAARASLFEKYATGGRREWHNAGLGLYLCRLVAEAHGGRCALVERPGWNVSFEAAFPRR